MNYRFSDSAVNIEAASVATAAGASSATLDPPDAGPLISDLSDAEPRQQAAADDHVAADLVDVREALFNVGAVGTAAEIATPAELITALRGILLDVDPKLLKPEICKGLGKEPASYYETLVQPWLQQDPVLRKAQVRVSGIGLHVILSFSPAIVLATPADRCRWEARIRVIQRVLPVDPAAPGINAMTRPVGSINGKNGRTVSVLTPGEPVTAAEVEALFDRILRAPFSSIASILLGDNSQISPCPVCRVKDSTLRVTAKVGHCYGPCGKVTLGRLYDCFLRTPKSRKD